MTTTATPGLDGVEVAETSLGDVRGAEGFFHYREYSATELARERDVLEVAHLLLCGDLPADEHVAAGFAARVADGRWLPSATASVLERVASTTAPLDSLRTAVSVAAGELGWAPSLDLDRPELLSQAMRLIGLTPTVVAAAHRLRSGLEPLAPRADLGHVANLLWMITAEEPTDARVRALGAYLVLTIDHGFNASTFTARVVTSTGADLGSAVVAALGALSGPLHGGAPSRALDMLDRVDGPDDARRWVRRRVASGERVMGFGHRIYSTDDPRSVLLRDVAMELGGERVASALAVEAAVVDTLAELKPGRSLFTNVEFYAGVVMEACGIPRELFTPVFACSRTIGWVAHVLEQAGANRLIRPAARYVGPEPPRPVPARSAAVTPVG